MSGNYYNTNSFISYNLALDFHVGVIAFCATVTEITIQGQANKAEINKPFHFVLVCSSNRLQHGYLKPLPEFRYSSTKERDLVIGQ